MRLARRGRGDFVTELRVAPRRRRADPSLPGTVRVRLIRVTLAIRGSQTTIRLATGLLDPEGNPADEIARLYAARWRVGTLIRELKVA